MVKVGLIGKGKWGKIIDKTIKDLSLSDDFFNINFVLNILLDLLYLFGLMILLL